MCWNKKKKRSFDSYNFTVLTKQTGQKKGADIIGTDFIVPTSDTLDWTFYTYRNEQYLVTSITTYFFFFIKFTYDEYIIVLPEGKYSSMPTAEQVCKEIDECEKWNMRDVMEPIKTSEKVAAFIYNNQVDGYDLGNNDYLLMKYKV